MLEVYKIDADLYGCNANNSRAFELPTIEKHYLKEVRGDFNFHGTRYI